MIDGENLLKRFTSIHMQFELALRAVEGFKGSKEAVDKYSAQELDELRKLITEAPSKDFDPSKHWAFSPDGADRYLKGLKEHLESQLADVVNRLRQNRLILLVTFAETFLKDVHREVLRQNPKLLKADRQVPLGKLVATSAEDIVNEEIEREVQSLDRKTLKEREAYFDKHLNINWFDGKILPLVEPVFGLRNRILHEDPDTRVSEQDVKLAHVVCLALPMGCLMQAAVLYPKGFQLKNFDPAGMKAVMEKQGRLKPTNGMQPTPTTGAADAKR